MANEPQNRRSSGISVRVFGVDSSNKPFSKPATAFCISDTTAKLSGIDKPLRPGDVVGLQSNAGRCRFRVTSIDSEGANASQIEVVSIDAVQNVWTYNTSIQPSPDIKAGLPPHDQVVAKAQPCGAAFKQERRRFERYKCDFGASVEFDGGKRLWVRCADVSMGGCYLETWSPLPVGADFRLELEGILISAAVSTCHPNVGMGVRFTEVTAPQRLEALIERLSHGTA